MNKFLAALLSLMIIPVSTVFAATPAPKATSSPEPPAATSAPSASPVFSAAPTVRPTAIPEKYKADSVDFDISVIKHDYVTDSTMKLELYNMSGELLGLFEHWIGGITEGMTAHFKVPEYAVGEKFRLKTVDGVNYMKNGSALAGKGNSLVFTTSGHTDENNNYVQDTLFKIECEPQHEKSVNMYMPDGLRSFSPRARVLDGVTMVPVRQAAENLGLKVRYNEQYNCVICSAGKDEIIFNVGTNWNTILGKETTASAKSRNIGGTVYVPLRVLTDAVGSSLEVKDYGERLDIAIGKSELVTNYLKTASPVNARGISSDTSYLVWISKSEFKVRVYTGSRYDWNLEKEFPCAIGAPGSETVTGTFKYQYRMPRWDYGTYYVGPCLVFYGNYAMHSTLLYYGGGAYDDRVGVKISHGCVRLHKNDINWLDSYLPRGSTVYITE